MLTLSNSFYIYGFKTAKCPSSVKELVLFENNIMDMIKNLELLDMIKNYLYGQTNLELFAK